MMDTLPDEMLQEIMEYLRYSDLKCFRLVCMKFYEASLAFHIVNRENFAYGNRMNFTPYRYNFDNFMKILSTTERNFYHFHFVNTEITAAFREFVEKRAKFILSFKFDRCKILYPMNFCESINECTKLKSLTLHEVSWPDGNHAATISLPALETMDLSCIPNDMFNELMDTNVKNLHLFDDYCNVNYVIRTRGRLNDLKCLDLWDFCDDEQLMNIADNLNLTTIRFSCRYVTNQGFKFFVEKQRKLHIVEISRPKFITDESLVAIAENLKDLKELIIYGHFAPIQYSFDGLNRIINFTPVRCLDVDGSGDVSGFVTTVGDIIVSKCLRQLRIHYVQNETYVTYIAENFLSLTELGLMSSNGVTNETLLLICQNLKNLKKLILKECNAINAFENDVTRLTFSANFNNLEELDLSWSEWLSDSTLETCFKLSSLRILNLSHCKNSNLNIRENVLATVNIIYFLKCLTVKSFVAMPKNFPCLEDLDMTGIKIDDDVLLSTVSLMKRVRILKISVVSEPVAEHLLHSLYEHSDSLQRILFDKSRFIRSWELKTFVEAILCVLYDDDNYRKQWYENLEWSDDEYDHMEWSDNEE